MTIIRENKKRILKLRDEWLAALDLENADELLFEMEMLIKGIDRFFNIDNLAISDPNQVINRDFNQEIRIIYGALERINAIVRIMLARETDNAYYFNAFIENELLLDYARDKFMNFYLDQQKPQDSLYLLKMCFANLLEVFDSLASMPRTPYQLYVQLGQLCSREIAINMFFNPLLLQAFDPNYDRIRNPIIALVVNQIGDETLRKQVSITILALYRLLHYLNFISADSTDKQELKDNLLIFSLLSSDAKVLQSYLESDLRCALKKVTLDDGSELSEQKDEFCNYVDSVAFQISMEMRKVFGQILKDLSEFNNLVRLRSSIESSKGILQNFLQQSIVMIVQVFRGVEGHEIFPDFTSRVEQSMRLREDLWVFHEIFDLYEKAATADPPDIEAVLNYFATINAFIHYFQSLSYKLVRYADHEHFDKFFSFFSEVSNEDLQNKYKLKEINKNFHYFKMFLETTLGQINQRTELQERPLNSMDAGKILAQFL
jgi:hypothetical protein